MLCAAPRLDQRGWEGQGRDYEIAMKLPVMFRNAGLPDPNLALIHPIYVRGEEKRLWKYTLFEIRAILEQFGIASASEINRLAADFAAVASADTCAVAQVPLAACWARKT